MEKLSSKLIAILVKEKLIHKSESEIYLYGLNIFFKYLLNIILVIIVSIINYNFKDILFFVFFFTIIRSYAGGLHLKTSIFCTIFSIIFIQFYSILDLTVLTKIGYSRFLFVFLISFLIYRVGPIDNKNKQLEQIEQIYFKKKLFKVLCFCILTLILCEVANFNNIVNIIIMSLFFNLISMLIGLYAKKVDTIFFL